MAGIIRPMSRGRPRTLPLPPVNNRLRELRDRKNLSIAALSKMTSPKVAGSTIQRHETGEAEMTTYYMEIYAHALGVAPEELLPDALRISASERELLHAFSRLPEKAKKAWLASVKAYAEVADSARIEDELLPNREAAEHR